MYDTRFSIYFLIDIQTYFLLHKNEWLYIWFRTTGKKLSKVTKKVCLIIMLNYYWHGFNLQEYLIICKVQDRSNFYLCRTSKFFGVLQDSISFSKGCGPSSKCYREKNLFRNMSNQYYFILLQSHKQTNASMLEYQKLWRMSHIVSL